MLTPPARHAGGSPWRPDKAPHAAVLSLLPVTGWLTNIERCMMFDAIAAADSHGVFRIATGQWGKRVGIRGNHITTHRKKLREWHGMRPPIIRALEFNNGAQPARYSLALPGIDHLLPAEFEERIHDVIPDWTISTLIAESDGILDTTLDPAAVSAAAPWLQSWTSPVPPQGVPPWTSPPPSPVTSPTPSPIPPPGLVQFHRPTSSTSTSTSSMAVPRRDLTTLVTEATTPLALTMLRRSLAPLGYDEPTKLISIAQHIAINVNGATLASEHLRINPQSVPSIHVAAFAVMSSIVAKVCRESSSNQDDDSESLNGRSSNAELLSEIHQRFDRLTGMGEVP